MLEWVIHVRSQPSYIAFPSLYPYRSPNFASEQTLTNTLFSANVSYTSDYISPPIYYDFTWIVDIGDDLKLSDSPVFFFGINGTTRVSHYFNISDPFASPSSTSPSTTTTTTTTTTPSPQATETLARLPIPVFTHQRSSSDLSTGAKAGIGIGVAIAALLSLAAALFCWRWRWLRRNRRSSTTTPDMHSKSPFLINGERSGFPLASEMDAAEDERRPKELHSQDFRAEMDSSVRRGKLEVVEPGREREPVEMPAVKDG